MAQAEHEFGPFFTPESEILILGSFPSVKSREKSFYYAHPQNRFWRVLACCYGEDAPAQLDEKKSFLIRHRVALWDVIESCTVTGSSDASIRSAVPTDIEWLLSVTHIRRIILNGRTAERYFNRFFPGFRLPTVTMPSTSPANAAWSAEKLCEAWGSALIIGEKTSGE